MAASSPRNRHHEMEVTVMMIDPEERTACVMNQYHEYKIATCFRFEGIMRRLPKKLERALVDESEWLCGGGSPTRWMELIPIQEAVLSVPKMSCEACEDSETCTKEPPRKYARTSAERDEDSEDSDEMTYEDVTEEMMILRTLIKDSEEKSAERDGDSEDSAERDRSLSIEEATPSNMSSEACEDLEKSMEEQVRKYARTSEESGEDSEDCDETSYESDRELSMSTEEVSLSQLELKSRQVLIGGTKANFESIYSARVNILHRTFEVFLKKSHFKLKTEVVENGSENRYISIKVQKQLMHLGVTYKPCNTNITAAIIGDHTSEERAIKWCETIADKLGNKMWSITLCQHGIHSVRIEGHLADAIQQEVCKFRKNPSPWQGNVSVPSPLHIELRPPLRPNEKYVEVNMYIR